MRTYARPCSTSYVSVAGYIATATDIGLNVLLGTASRTRVGSIWLHRGYRIPRRKLTKILCQKLIIILSRGYSIPQT